MRRALAVGLLLSACVADARLASEAVVYGTDDRVEPYEHPSAPHRAVAQSAIAMELSSSWLDTSDPRDVRITYERTLGEAHDLCPGQRFASQIEPGTCSGTLVDRRHILTAAHCVDEPDDCDGSTSWVLGFRYVAAGTLATLDVNDVYSCERVVVASDDGTVDFALVELDRDVVGHTPATVRTAAPLPVGAPLVLIGHPNGLPMKIASGGVITTTGARSLTATLDAFSGNSGSGVFDASGVLVALLDSGETDYVVRGDCEVVNVIDPAPADDGEGLTYARPAIMAFCATASGRASPLCACDGGPCEPMPDAGTPETDAGAEPVDAARPGSDSGAGGSGDSGIVEPTPTSNCACRAGVGTGGSSAGGWVMSAAALLLLALRRHSARTSKTPT